MGLGHPLAAQAGLGQPLRPHGVEVLPLLPRQAARGQGPLGALGRSCSPQHQYVASAGASLGGAVAVLQRQAAEDVGCSRKIGQLDQSDPLWQAESAASTDVSML